VRERIDEIYAEHTEKPKEEVRKDMERDRFFNAAQALEYGLIDRVLESH
jgi:ATP-dependent Clp protease protease subunit